jgi:phosphoglycolate phosphatase-like HAD superfamily hydrolase
MDGLVEMVAEFDLVPESQRLDAFGYKAVYNDALMEMVNDRMARIRRGELAPSDFIMKGAIPFLEALRARGVTLFLASGTDEADVIREAEALGYAGLFDGGIHGAKPGSRADSKEAVIRDIIAQIQAADAGADGAAYLVVGDGPVEIRLARRLGGLALGVASDEARRFGWNDAKRRRVIRAGAHAVLPDFSQWQTALDFLFGG